MNTFATLMCLALIATVTANVGYNYQPQGPLGGGGSYSPQQASGYPSGPAQQYAPPPNDFPAPSPQFAQQGQQQQQYQPQQQLNGPSQFGGQFAASNQAPQFAASNQAPVQYSPPAQQSGGFGGSSGSGQAQFNQQPQQQTIITKGIYIHSAPEETEEVSNDQGGEPEPIRKNYRIVFIKAPAQKINFNLQSLKQSQAANEEKTIIYVLAKKPEINNIQSQLASAQAQPKPQKPEVYFIKYKTAEEAQRAQQEIQAQYDALGGSTQISDEGIAPVTSVIGGGPVNIGGGGGGGFSGAAGGAAGGFGGAGGSNNGASFNGNSNFGQSAQGSQASASNVNFAVQAPSNKYLPAKKK